MKTIEFKSNNFYLSHFKVQIKIYFLILNLFLFPFSKKADSALFDLEIK
jgi:hypothetical protein